ncbi:MAG: hypothetical protein ACRDJT_06300 [Actinomycetota bacterium]
MLVLVGGHDDRRHLRAVKQLLEVLCYVVGTGIDCKLAGEI